MRQTNLQRQVRRAITIALGAISAFFALFFEINGEVEGLIISAVLALLWLMLMGGGNLVNVRKRAVDFASERLKPAVGWTAVAAVTLVLIGFFLRERLH